MSSGIVYNDEIESGKNKMKEEIINEKESEYEMEEEIGKKDVLIGSVM